MPNPFEQMAAQDPDLQGAPQAAAQQPPANIFEHMAASDPELQGGPQPGSPPPQQSNPVRDAWRPVQQAAYNAPYGIGKGIQSMGQVFNNANQAGQNFFQNIQGKGADPNAPHALAGQFGAGVTGAASGLAGLGESAVGLAGQAFSPQTRDAMGQDLQTLTGGELPSKRISDLGHRYYPHDAATQATGEAAAMLAPIPGVNRIEMEALGLLMKNPVLKGIAEEIAKHPNIMNPVVKGAAKGAPAGAVYNAAVGAGNKYVRGEQPTAQSVGEDVGAGATMGATIGGALGPLTSKGKKPPEGEVQGPPKPKTEADAVRPEKQMGTIGSSGSPGFDYWHQPTEPKGEIQGPSRPPHTTAWGQGYDFNSRDAQAARAEEDLQHETRRQEEPKAPPSRKLKVTDIVPSKGYDWRDQKEVQGRLLSQEEARAAAERPSPENYNPAQPVPTQGYDWRDPRAVAERERNQGNYDQAETQARWAALKESQGQRQQAGAEALSKAQANRDQFSRTWPTGENPTITEAAPPEAPRKISDVTRPEPPQFKNIMEAMDAAGSKDPATRDAGQRFIDDDIARRTAEAADKKAAYAERQKAQEAVRPKLSEVLKPAPQEDFTPPEPAQTQAPPVEEPPVDAFNEAIKGKVQDEPMAPGEAEGRQAADDLYKEMGKIQPTYKHEEKEKVPIGEVTERDRKTPFDYSNPEPRPGVWNGKYHAIEPHPTADGHVTVGPQIGTMEKGLKEKTKVDAAMDRMRRGVTVGQLLRDAGEGGLTEPQRWAAENQLGRNIPPDQRAVIEQALERDKRKPTEQSEPPEATNEAVKGLKGEEQAKQLQDAIDNNDMAALDKMAQQPPKKLSTLQALENMPPIGVFSIAPMVLKLAKFAGKTPKWAAEEFFGKKGGAMVAKAAENFVKMNNTLDHIREGADSHGDSIYKSLIRNLGSEAHHTRGLKLEGAFAAEARQAIRSEDPAEILNPNNHTNWTPAQRKQVAARKIHRVENADMIQEVLDRHGNTIDPTYKKALEEYQDVQYGSKGPEPDSLEQAMNDITGNLYNAFFRWNPAFHALVATHPLQMGTAVAGVHNIATAYHQLISNPSMRKLYGDLTEVTHDPRQQMAEESRVRQAEDSALGRFVNKPLAKFLAKDISTARVNNNVIHLGGMLKKANELSKGHGLEMVQKLADGTLSADQSIELHTAGMEALIDATGGGTFGMNKNYLQSSPVFKYFAQLSGYKSVVARYNSKLIRGMVDGAAKGDMGKVRDHFASYATLTGMTILLGGHAVIPKEAEEPLAKIMGPSNLYGLEAGLDKLNLLRKGGVDLTRHLQYSALNYGENAIGQSMATMGRDLIKSLNPEAVKDKTPAEVYTDTLGHALMMTRFSSPGGIGMSTLMRAKQGLMDVRRGYKKFNVYSQDLESPSPFPDEKHMAAVNTGDMLYKLFAPGEETREGNVEQRVKFNKYFKKHGTRGEHMPNMEEEYPVKHKGIDQRYH